MLNEILSTNTSTDYLLALLVIFAIFFGGLIFNFVILSRLQKMSEKTSNNIDDMAVLAIKTFNRWFYLILGVYISLKFFLDLGELVNQGVTYVFFIYLGIQISIALCKEVNFYIKTHAKKFEQEYKGLSGALPAVGTVVKILIWLLVMTTVLSNLGFNVNSVIAGLGIGGVAFAFAFQRILADLFSAFVIFLDRPFTVGDSIDVNGISGEVEYIGLKTTKLRAFTGELFVVPNQDLASASLSNITRASRRRTDFALPIKYGTIDEKLKKVPGIVERIVTNQDKVTYGFTKLSSLGEKAILFNVRYYVESDSYALQRDVQENVLFELIETLGKEGIELGYPVEFPLGSEVK